MLRGYTVLSQYEKARSTGKKLTCCRQGKFTIIAFRAMLAQSDHETMTLMGARQEQNKIKRHFLFEVSEYFKL